MFLITGLVDNVKLISSCVTGVVAVCSGYVYFDGPIPVSKHYVEEHLDKRLTPIILVQNTQTKSIDRFLLFQLQEALRRAKTDPAAATSPVIQEHIRDLESQVRDTETRINASGR